MFVSLISVSDDRNMARHALDRMRLIVTSIAVPGGETSIHWTIGDIPGLATFMLDEIIKHMGTGNQLYKHIPLIKNCRLL